MIWMLAAEGRPVLAPHLISPAAHSSSTVRTLVRASGAVSRTRCPLTSCRGPSTAFTPFLPSGGTLRSTQRRRAAV